VNNVGKSLYFVGSDYVWGRKMGEALKTAFEAQGGSIMGMEFFPLHGDCHHKKHEKSVDRSPMKKDF
jgi:hypothetical protein